jgi:hypothetical protein
VSPSSPHLCLLFWSSHRRLSFANRSAEQFENAVPLWLPTIAESTWIGSTFLHQRPSRFIHERLCSIVSEMRVPLLPTPLPSRRFEAVLKSSHILVQHSQCSQTHQLILLSIIRVIDHLLIFLLLLLMAGELWLSSRQQIACEATVVSSLRWLRQPASSTPVGLCGTEEEDALLR